MMDMLAKGQVKKRNRGGSNRSAKGLCYISKVEVWKILK